MNFKKIVIIAFGLILVAFAGDYYIRFRQRESIVIEIAARRLSVSGPYTFHFVLREDRTLVSSRGIRRISSHQREDFKSPLFTRSILETVNETVEMQITEEEYNNLINLANRIPMYGEREELFALSLGILEIYYNGKLFRGQYPTLLYEEVGISLSVMMNELLNEIVRLSPLLERLP